MRHPGAGAMGEDKTCARLLWPALPISMSSFCALAIFI